jgi:predicted GNAT family N-acyltransferase
MSGTEKRTLANESAPGRETGGAEVSIRVGDWKQLRACAMSVRYAVFVQEQGIPARFELDQYDPVSVHVVALDPCGVPLGTGRLLPDGHIGRMAVLRSARGHGVGTVILRTLVAIAKSRGVQELRLHAQLTAVPFYEQQGFVTIGEPYDEVGILHRTMVRSLRAEA